MMIWLIPFAFIWLELPFFALVAMLWIVFTCKGGTL